MVATGIRYDKEQATLYCYGDWRIAQLATTEAQIHQLAKITSASVQIDGSLLSHLDSAGALLIYQLLEKFQQTKIKTSLVKFTEQHSQLFSMMKEKMAAVGVLEQPVEKNDPFTFIGKQTVKRVKTGLEFLSFVGEISLIFRRLFAYKQRFQMRSILRVIQDAGFHALPIIALLSFLVGVVLAYQIGRQLQSYGANIFIIDLCGIAILREFGPLITAIIVAGRTGSSFTAQIGLMKVNEEIDALKTMGLTPYNRIVIPRVLAMMLVVPLLTMWSNAFAVFGSMVMSRSMLGITAHDFISRFADRIDNTTLWTGLGKTPVFAIAIALVGCFQGFRVKYTADSIGVHTTMSVVQALFLIIVIDAIFSILYSWADL
jgi:phospholipid/cholesterol/gamma-HCH transport system permease protein